MVRAVSTDTEEGEAMKQYLIEDEMVRLIRSQRDLFHFLVKDLELPIRVSNCLRQENIQSVGELLQRTPQELLRIPNFGKKSLQDLVECLEKWHFKLGVPEQEITKRIVPSTKELSEFARTLVRFFKQNDPIFTRAAL